MPDQSEVRLPPPAFGMTGLVLGSIALLLAFLPVLGVPISAFGLFFALVGVFLGFFAPVSSLRWSLGGVAIASLALALNLAIVYAPGGYLPQRQVLRQWDPVPDRPHPPPPARP